MFSKKWETNAGPQNHFHWKTNNFSCLIHRKIKSLSPLKLSVITTVFRIVLEKVSQLKPWLPSAGTFGICAAWEYS